MNCCPTCNHTVHFIGVSGPTDDQQPVHWCPRCGSLKVAGSGGKNVQTPRLVERVRMLRKDMMEADGFLPWDERAWHRLGIDESISTEGSPTCPRNSG